MSESERRAEAFKHEVAVRPLPREGERDDAECPNCGHAWDDEDWIEHHYHGGASAGESWKYECPNCERETFEVAI